MSRETSFGDEQFYGRVEDSTYETDLVFVIMPFADDMNDTYSAIKDECLKLGLNSMRVDETVGSGIVLRKIYDLIERAEFIIVDLTHERPNVYYELGYAHGLGNIADELLLVAREGTELHFDIAPLSVQFYKSTEHLRKIASAKLKAMISTTRR